MEDERFLGRVEQKVVEKGFLPTFFVIASVIVIFKPHKAREEEM